jgi:Uma2 family endonuclease
MINMGEPAKKMDGRFCYRDYKNWPNDERWELIDGIAWDMSPAPSRKHQWIVMELGALIRNHLKGKKCQIYPAPFDVFIFEPNEEKDDIRNIVQPDLTVICDREKLKGKGCFGAPDLVVEILSPYTSKKDLNEKFNLYERSGVREYWVFDPGFQALQIYRITDKGRFSEADIFEQKDLVTSVVLEGFQFRLSEIFEDYTGE